MSRILLDQKKKFSQDIYSPYPNFLHFNILLIQQVLERSLGYVLKKEKFLVYVWRRREGNGGREERKERKGERDIYF